MNAHLEQAVFAGFTFGFGRPRDVWRGEGLQGSPSETGMDRGDGNSSVGSAVPWGKAITAIQLNKSENQLVRDCSFSVGILLTFYHLITLLMQL